MVVSSACCGQLLKTSMKHRCDVRQNLYLVKGDIQILEAPKRSSLRIKISNREITKRN